MICGDDGDGGDGDGYGGDGDGDGDGDGGDVMVIGHLHYILWVSE